MHELSIVESMVETANAFAREHEIAKVSALTVQVGALTGVVPKYVRMYYADLAKGTALEGSELTIEEIPAEAFCRACGEVFDPTVREGRCPACGSENREILHGEELTVKDLGYM